jgi:hypothetical protein
MRRQFLLAACVWLGLGADGADAQPDRTSVATRCEIAWAYVQEVLEQQGAGRIVFSTEPGSLLDRLSVEAPWGRVEKGLPVAAQSPTPSADLIEALNRAPSGSAVRRCASIRRKLTRRHVPFGARAERAAIRPLRNGYFRRRVEGVSLPVISSDGREALLLSTSVAAPLSGGGQAIHLFKGEDGRWRTIAAAGLWVS